MIIVLIAAGAVDLNHVDLNHMNKEQIKKLIAGALAAGGIATGAIQAQNAINCDYKIQNVCVSQEEIDAV